MTAVEVLALLLGAGGLVVGALFLSLVAASARKLGDHLGAVTKPLHRIALALEKAANDRPAQVEAKKHAEMSENLVMGISTVLDTTLTHPVGLKDDVIIGREQAEQELKDQLRAELNKALNHTN